MKSNDFYCGIIIIIIGIIYAYVQANGCVSVNC